MMFASRHHTPTCSFSFADLIFFFLSGFPKNVELFFGDCVDDHSSAFLSVNIKGECQLLDVSHEKSVRNLSLS